MKYCSIDIPFVYFKDCIKKDRLELRKLENCIPRLARVLESHHDEGSLYVDLILEKNPECERMFSLQRKAEKDFLDDMGAHSREKLKDRLLLAYVSGESGIVKAVQPRY